LLTQVQKDLSGASSAQLLSLCLGGQVLGRPALAYVAAGQGLARDGVLAHRFLLARGQALRACWGPTEQDRARECLRAARELANRARDLDAVREAAMALDELPDFDLLGAFLTGTRSPLGETSLTQEDIHNVISHERDILKVPQFPLTKGARKPRKSKPPRRRLPRGLLDDMLSLLDSGGRW
jgi:hypothetical protein